MCWSCERSKDVKQRGDVFKVRKDFCCCSLLVTSQTFASEEVSNSDYKPFDVSKNILEESESY